MITRLNESPEALAADPQVRAALASIPRAPGSPDKKRLLEMRRNVLDAEIVELHSAPSFPGPQEEEALRREILRLERLVALHRTKRTLEEELHNLRSGRVDRKATMQAVIAPVLDQCSIEVLRNRSRPPWLIILRVRACRLLYDAGFSQDEIGNFLHRERSNVAYLLRKKEAA